MSTPAVQSGVPEHTIDMSNTQYTNKQASYNNDQVIPSPVGDLSLYRSGMDSPYTALTNKFGIFNQVTSILVNFFVNVGALYVCSN